MSGSSSPRLLGERGYVRAGDALVTLFRDQPVLAGELGLTAEVLPKGRNFH